METEICYIIGQNAENTCPNWLKLVEFRNGGYTPNRDKALETANLCACRESANGATDVLCQQIVRHVDDGSELRQPEAATGRRCPLYLNS